MDGALTTNQAIETTARREGGANPTVGAREVIALAAILAAAAGLRFVGLLNELWMDEIGSLLNVADLRSWTAIFVDLKTDNNHHLNSLWLYAIGPGAASWKYRSLSFVAGVATVAVAWLIGRRQSSTVGLATAFLFAVAYPFVYYSSEARGYSPLVFLVLAGLYCLLNALGDRRWLLVPAFWICVPLGLLAHATFLFFLIGALLWFDAHAERSLASARRGTAAVVLAFGPAVAATVVIYWMSFRGLRTEAGQHGSILLSASQALSIMINGPTSGSYLWVAAGLATLVSVCAVADFVRRNDRLWVLFVAGGVVVPALFLFARPTVGTYSRYFLAPCALLLVAMGDLLGRLWQRSPLGRSVSVAIMVFMGAGALMNADALYRNGRGRFDDAVRHMTDLSGDVTTVSSAPDFQGHDGRVAMALGFYSRSANRTGRLRYVEQPDYPAGGTEWIIRESLDPDAASRELRDEYGNLYALDRTYPVPALAEISWVLYRRAEITHARTRQAIDFDLNSSAGLEAHRTRSDP